MTYVKWFAVVALLVLAYKVPPHVADKIFDVFLIGFCGAALLWAVWYIRYTGKRS
jgi:hypothetical protein